MQNNQKDRKLQREEKARDPKSTAKTPKNDHRHKTTTEM